MATPKPPNGPRAARIEIRAGCRPWVFPDVNSIHFDQAWRHHHPGDRRRALQSVPFVSRTQRAKTAPCSRTRPTFFFDLRRFHRTVRERSGGPEFLQTARRASKGNILKSFRQPVSESPAIGGGGFSSAILEKRSDPTLRAQVSRQSHPPRQESFAGPPAFRGFYPKDQDPQALVLKFLRGLNHAKPVFFALRVELHSVLHLLVRAAAAVGGASFNSFSRGADPNRAWPALQITAPAPATRKKIFF